jgi:hypothetical protein
MKTSMETQTWEVSYLFPDHINGDLIRFVDSPFQKPKGIRDIVGKYWFNRLKKKQDELAQKGIKTRILQYRGIGELVLGGGIQTFPPEINMALYEGSGLNLIISPDNGGLSLKSVNRGEGREIRLSVGEVNSPYIDALEDEEASKLYEVQCLEKPTPLFEICTFAATKDSKLALIVKDERASAYPSRLDVVRRVIRDSHEVITASQVSVISEILRVYEGYGYDYNHNQIRFGGIVVDKDEFSGKPYLIGWVPLSVESGDLRERVMDRNPEKIPSGIADITFAPADEVGLLKYLIESDPKQYSPAAHGGLFVYGMSNFGDYWGRCALKNMEQRS